jgi:hypothetical protein
MIYSRKGYKIDNSKSLILLNLHLMVCYALYKCNRKLKTSWKADLVTRNFIAHK